MTAPGASAKDAVSMPALCLALIGALAALYALFNLLGGPTLVLSLVAQSPALPPELKEQLSFVQRDRDVFSERLIFGVDLLGSLLILFGGVQMRRLKARPLAIAASIVVMVPLITWACCLPGLGAGIWALAVLFKPEVKAAFG